ncbi:MAG: hypothetical protein ACKODX_07505 [Gemmata sp.]
MTIDGVSQTTGTERLVAIEPDAAGVRLTISDRKGNAELAQVGFVANALMTVLTDVPPGPQTIAGADGRVLTVEVNRNEVLLTVGAPDAAVGLDDLLDALAEALPPT